MQYSQIEFVQFRYNSAVQHVIPEFRVHLNKYQPVISTREILIVRAPDLTFNDVYYNSDHNFKNWLI